MKRKVFIILAVVAVAFGVACCWWPDGSVDLRDFESGLRETVQKNGWQIASESSCNPGGIPLPMAVRWDPHRWLKDESRAARAGFPNGAECFVVARGGSPAVSCSVRYLENRVCCVRIAARKTEGATATALESALRREFPGLPIELEIR